MMNIRKRLANLYTHHSDRSMSQQNYGKARSPDEMLSAMSDAIPDDDKKWQLTNIGGIGSDEDKELREKAAESEAEFDGAGEQPGLEMWRIEKFSPQRVDISSSKLSLFSGDCYIVLKTIQKDDSDALEWHIHYWIGKDSTQDESGSAAYFAVNLDDMLGQKVCALSVQNIFICLCHFVVSFSFSFFFPPNFFDVILLPFSPSNTVRSSLLNLPSSILISVP